MSIPTEVVVSIPKRASSSSIRKLLESPVLRNVSYVDEIVAAGAAIVRNKDSSRCLDDISSPEKTADVYFASILPRFELRCMHLFRLIDDYHVSFSFPVSCNFINYALIFHICTVFEMFS
jgi:hypothetical protein